MKDSEIDLNKDGKISSNEIELSKKVSELRETIRKSESQKRMAWLSLVGVLLITAVVFLPIIPDARITLLGDIISMFYIAMAGIISTYLGVSTWISKEPK